MATVGILALQGDVREHAAMVESIGYEAREVRVPDDLSGLSGIVLPGGESTTIGKLATRYGVLEPLRERIAGGMPALGTCAGMILLAEGVVGRDQPLLRAVDMVVRRNAFGRQNESFEADLEVEGLEQPFHAVFIRAPWVEKAGAGVEVLAEVDGHPVLVRQGAVMAAAFHPELTGDGRIHELALRGAD